MCGTCGCSDNPEDIKISRPGDGGENGHSHHHTHAHGTGNAHGHAHHGHHSAKKVIIEKDALHENNLLAMENRGYFKALGIMAINLVSSPGSGKTTLLEKTIKLLKDKKKIFVIEGDQQTMNDARRIELAGATAVQVNTGNGCHLDAHMVSHAVEKLNLEKGSLLFIENVGNLVCPALFDLGEAKRVVVMSVTEGDDKPLKYPNMFLSSQLCIINKTDLLPYVDCQIEKIREYALQINRNLEFIELSAKTEEGMEQWVNWLIQG